MASSLDPRERLRRAGLDLDLPLPRRELGEGERFCPYTGRELSLVLHNAGREDRGRIGFDAFTEHGRVLRYQVGGAAEVVDDPTNLSGLRGTVDLLASSGLPLPERALRHQLDEPAAEALRMMAPGMGELTAVVTRHGRLYALASFGPRQHALHAWTVPQAGTAAGWRPPRLTGELATAAGHRAGTMLRVSETLVYANLADRLAAWHAGSGEHLVDWPWPSPEVALARLAFDRLLLVREESAGLVAEVYDLAQVAGGPCRPLSGQARLLGPVPAHQPQPLWAEACDEQFVVVDADGKVHALPFDGPGRELFPNVEGVRLGPPVFRDSPDGVELVAFAHNERGRWLLLVPLDADRPCRFEPLGDRELASQELTPCFAGEHFFSAHAATDENVRVIRHPAGELIRPESLAEVPGTAGSRIDGLERVLMLGRPLVLATYSQTTYRFWVGGVGLDKLLLDPPLPQISIRDRCRVLWDAGGVYVCHLADGVAYVRRPQP